MLSNQHTLTDWAGQYQPPPQFCPVACKPTSRALIPEWTLINIDHVLAIFSDQWNFNQFILSPVCVRNE